MKRKIDADSNQLQISLENNGLKQNLRGLSFGNYDEIENPLELPTELNEFEGPTLFYCQHCKMDSVSVCEYKSTTQTLICAFLLFFILNIIGCFIPFSSTACKDRRQLCPKCKNIIGVQKYDACAC